ncbi:hypothetical protein ACFC1T_19760 [Kitasatospora sp. NPDC056076]|uniref:hypothetical protein n=1 Tax=Kitasatospora sp. NPDC056076 TaxID=3345703 RepID=UPI0035D929E3
MTLAPPLPPVAPPWWHPLAHLHHRTVDRRTATAAKDLRAAVGRRLDVGLLRRALACQGDGELVFRIIAVGFLAVMLVGFILSGMKGLCTPGGYLPTSGGEVGPCPTHQEKVYVAETIALWAAAFIAAASVYGAVRATAVRPAQKPVFPALLVLRACARLHEPGAGHAEAAGLSVKAQALGQALIDAAGRAADDYGARASTRELMLGHARQVAALLERTADELLPDRDRATRKLAELAAVIAEQVADGQFTNLLREHGQPPDLPTSAPESPDRADGRRLAMAAVTALLVTVSLAVTTGMLGLPAFVTAPLAAITVPLLTFLLLAHRFGLSEAVRLVQVLRTVRGENPVEPTAAPERQEAGSDTGGDPPAGEARGAGNSA